MRACGVVIVCVRVARLLHSGALKKTTVQYSKNSSNPVVHARSLVVKGAGRHTIIRQLLREPVILNATRPWGSSSGRRHESAEPPAPAFARSHHSTPKQIRR